MRAIALLDGGSYSYAGIGYANPHAVTQIANGLSTTTYSYDQNGNLVQKTTDGVTTTYVWDYANRLVALGSGGATTTYGYDAFGSRVFQSTATSTTLYPFKWYSVASSTGSGAKYASSTEYIFNGDTLVSTVDQQLASGVATGTIQTRYIHPDHLGSTNVVTDASGTVVETLDYFPYGALRIDNGSHVSDREYIGERYDPNTNLNYFNSRYYQSDRGQFISRDPTFLAIGDPMKLKQLTGRTQEQILADPQLIHSYSYGRDNPITQKDPNGNTAYDALVIQLFKGADFAEGISTAIDNGANFLTMYGNPNYSASQQIGTLSSDARCNTPGRFGIGRIETSGSVAMRGYSHLSDDEREQIGLLKVLGHSIGAIARALRRPKSTISRELSRNRLPSGRYSPLHAAGTYQLRRRREALIEKDRASPARC